MFYYEGFMKKTFYLKNGFTLAEVLITLGIIGIVAAMTLPTVVQKHQEKVTVAKLKKMHSVLNQAFLMAVNENGTPDLWGYVASSSAETDPDKIAADKNGKDIVINKFLPYLKTTSVCYYNDSKCNNNSLYTRPRHSLDGTPFSNFGTPRIFLADGSTIDIFYMASPSCTTVAGTTKPMRNICGEVFIDINGIKPPNATGKDMFWFRITKFGIFPGGTETDTSRSFEEYCNISRKNELNGYGCAAWVIYNENMNYLHCSDLSWKGKKKC